jgi:hypothetical protein
MGASSVWFLLILSVEIVSIRTRVDGVRTTDIQTSERITDRSSRASRTGSTGSPPGALSVLRSAPSGNHHLGGRVGEDGGAVEKMGVQGNERRGQ